MAALIVAILVGYVVQESWAGRDITVDSLLFFLVVGITLGSIYAVAASGLVVTYTTSGIFNFAQGAMGMFLAFVYWELKVEIGMQTSVALLLTVLVAAPILGALVERVFMRRLATAPLVSQLVVTIGLMLFLIGLAATLWDPGVTRSVGTFYGSDGFHIGDTFVPWFRLITIVSGLLLALGIRLLLHRTRLGVSMRAVVDNRDLAALNGARPDLTAQFSWALGTAMAALAGVFLAEELATLSIETLTLLIIDAFAAAIIGRLTSLPMTYVGGMVIGLSLSFQANFLDWSGRWVSANKAIPTIILFLALLFLPQARIAGRRVGRVIAPRHPTIGRALFGFGLLIAGVFLLLGVLTRPDVRMVGLAMVTAFIMLSLVPLIGWSGQISLAQITFVGIGAWAAVELSTGGGWVFGLELFDPGSPWLLLAGAVVAVPIGVLMALPALRLQGLYLALATMAFARLAEFVIFDQPEVFGSGGRGIADLDLFGQNVTEPFSVLGLGFPQDAGFVLFITSMFCIFGFAIVLLRRGAFGRRLTAMKDSAAACATLGVNLQATKVAVFALSAAIAGFGGAMLGMLRGTASTANFQVLQGLPYVVLIVVGGASVVSGALLGSVLFQAPLFLVDRLSTLEISLPLLGTFQPFVIANRLGTGLLGIGLGRQPEGIVPEVSSELAERRRRRPTAVGQPGRALDREPVRVPDRVAVPARMALDPGAALLEVRDVGVRFGGLQALAEVSFRVDEGRITGLIGPNGAGKTTLFNVITGLQQPTSGRVLIAGEDITTAKPHTRARRGISRTFQRLETFGTLTARENVLVAAEMYRAWSHTRFDTGALADELIDRAGLRTVADEKVDKLATGAARLVEVARALASRPRVLLLDEPSAGLDERETSALGELLSDLTSDGLAVLLVEHDMSFVMGACEHIHVLDFGRLIAEGSPTQIQADPDVRAAYLGSEPPGSGGGKPDRPVVVVTASSNGREPSPAAPSGDALVLRGVRAAYGLIDVVHDVELTLPQRKVLALLGPNGAGKSTTLRVASGLVRPTRGSVHVLGEDVTAASADARARRGVCLVPEGRGIFPNLTVTENLWMATYSGTAFAAVLERSFERFPRLRERHKQVAGTLSGGEQQMLALARALATDPKVLLLDELSMGLAPLVVEELYDVVRQIAAGDVSILIVEQFAHEVLGVADTAAIMLHGRIEFVGAPGEVAEALDRAYLGGSVAG